MPASSLHSKLEPLSLEVKVKLAEVEVVLEGGPPMIEVLGAVVSVGEGAGAGVGVDVGDEPEVYS